jgi:hypothetical protein
MKPLILSCAFAALYQLAFAQTKKPGSTKKSVTVKIQPVPLKQEKIWPVNTPAKSKDSFTINSRQAIKTRTRL